MNEETLIADVSNKLRELGAFVDNDLPKYIVKLIINEHPITNIRKDLQFFLDSVNEPFMDWLEPYLNNLKATTSTAHSKKIEILSASEIEDDILDFEEEPQETDDQQLKNENLVNEIDDQLMKTNESINKRKLEKLDDFDNVEEEDSKRMLNNDKETIKMNSQGQNLIKLTDNTHLNDIGLMRRKAMQDQKQTLNQITNKSTDKSNSKSPKSTNQATDASLPEYDDGYVDLREKLNSRKLKNERNTLENINDQQMGSSDNEMKSDEDEKKERCRFWPFCKKEAECIYAHPTEQCKQFPSCKLGADKCLFIHPLCKFDSYCTKKDCPFLHIAKKPQLLPPVQPHPVMHPVMHVECKFFPNCYNVNCPFIHTKLCNYGAMCKNVNCTFKHLETSTNVAKPHQLKWTAGKNASNNNNESISTTDNETDQVIIKNENELDESLDIKDELNDSNLDDFDDDQTEIKTEIKAE